MDYHKTVLCKKHNNAANLTTIETIELACWLIKKAFTCPFLLLSKVTDHYQGKYILYANAFGDAGETPPLGSNFSLIFQVAEAMKRYKGFALLKETKIPTKVEINVSIVDGKKLVEVKAFIANKVR